MNKQRYLAELQRLLVFMSDADRAETVRRYAEHFDAVGPEGESELIALIGSPTKAAIGLSRGYEPGKLPELPQVTPTKKRPAPALTQTQDDPWGDLPTFDLPDYIEELMPEEEDDAPRDGGEKPFSMPDLPGHAAQRVRDGRETAEGRRGIPLGLGIPLFVLALAALGLPLAVLCIGVMAALISPGAAVLFCSYLIAVGGLWCVGFMADAILLFGAALIVLAFGLILLFGGIWLGVKLAALYIRGVRRLSGVLLGGRRAAYE